MTYRTCKRCSVARVNVLCRLYQDAFHYDQAGAYSNLTKLAGLAGERGHPGSSEILQKGLTSAKVRALCWNISSFLEDLDLERLGCRVDGHK